MADFFTFVSKLDACETDAQRLSMILEDIFEVNRINDEERFPVFTGTITEKITQAGKHASLIANVTTLWGTKLTINPYSKGSLRPIIRYGATIPPKGTRVVFKAVFGSSKYGTDLLAGETIRTFAQLQLDEHCSNSELANSVLSKNEFSEYSINVAKLLKKKGEYQPIYETAKALVSKVAALSQQLNELEEKQQRLAPNGLEAAIHELDALEKRIQTGIISKADVYTIGTGTLDKRIQITEDKLEFIQQRTDELAPDGIAAREAELDQLEERWDRLSDVESRITEIERKAKYYLGLQQMETQSTSESLLPRDEVNPIEEFSTRLEYKYDPNLVLSFLTALSTTQIITLFGAPGTGKTTFVDKTAKALGAKCSIISVQNSWTDSTDILGYYSPIDKTYESTQFVDALIDANKEWLKKGLNSRLHIICFDEMNLARVEYYFADFLSMLQRDPNQRWIRILPKHVQVDLEKLYTEEKLHEGKEYLQPLKEYADFLLPPNVRFVGTINSDDTTNFLSPKVIDRAYFIELSKEQRATKQEIGSINGYYPLRFFEIEVAPENSLLNLFKVENNRFMSYAKTMLVMYRDRLKALKKADAFCEQLIIAKILPALRKKSDYSYDSKRFEEAHTAFENHKSGNGDAYNYLGGNQ